MEDQPRNSWKREPKTKVWERDTSSRGGNTGNRMCWLKGRKTQVQGWCWWELPRLVSGDGTTVPFTWTNIYRVLTLLGVHTSARELGKRGGGGSKKG